MLAYRVYLIHPLPVEGLHSEGYLLISESELDTLIDGGSIVRNLSNGSEVDIYYRDLSMVVKD
jgi:hypothetical protein